MRAIGALALAALAATGTAGASPARDKATLLAIEHELGSVADANELPKFYDHEGAVLYDALAPAAIRGAERIRAAFATQLAGTKSVSTRFDEIDMRTSGDLGVVYSIQRITVGLADGSSRQIVCRATDIFARRRGGWKIVHQHISYPINPATGRAIFDSPAPQTSAVP